MKGIAKKPNKTTLWYVGVANGRTAIVVSKTDPVNTWFVHRIRTISANAAGRKFLREIYPSLTFSIDSDDCIIDDKRSEVKNRKRLRECKKNLPIIIR